MKLVNHFYDLVTDFYEYGWGDCFHFGFRFKGEQLSRIVVRRTEYYFASRLGLRREHLVVDVGCGVGGPICNIARFSGAKIVGVNNNAYQIKVGTKHNKELCFEQQCSYLQSDFMKINVPQATYDHAYAIEATCHAPGTRSVFIRRFSEPSSRVDNSRHTNGVSLMRTTRTIRNTWRFVRELRLAMVSQCWPLSNKLSKHCRKSGFRSVLDHFNAQRDAHLNKAQVPWYQTLSGQYTIAGIPHDSVGTHNHTHTLVSTLEMLGIAPKGSAKVSTLLNQTAVDLVTGGELEIFTPSFFFLARKPLQSSS